MSLNALLDLAMLFLALSATTLSLGRLQFCHSGQLTLFQNMPSWLKCLCFSQTYPGYLQLQLLPSVNLTSLTTYIFFTTLITSYLLIRFPYLSTPARATSRGLVAMSLTALFPTGLSKTAQQKYNVCHVSNCNHMGKAKRNLEINFNILLNSIYTNYAHFNV